MSTRAQSPHLIFIAGVLIVAVIAIAVLTQTTKAPEAKQEPAVPAPGVAAISPDAAKAAGITIAEAKPAQINETLTLYGTIKPNAEREQEVRARYAGVVRFVGKRVGDPVKRGETLISVEANESLQTYHIASPIGGHVLERSVNVGSSVGSETPLMKVADLSSMWAEFAVFARDVSRVRAGQTIRILASDGAAPSETAIAYVAPAGHADSQTVVARAVLDNRTVHWIAGQFVTAELVTTTTDAAVSVAPSALQTIEGKQVVFVQEDKSFHARPVTVGASSSDAVEIREGLRAGERYAANNSYLIKADLLKAQEAEE